MYFGITEKQVDEQLDRFLGWQGQGLAEFQGGAFSGEQASVAGVNAPFWVQLTSYDGSTFYAWTEQQPIQTSDGGPFVVLPGGRFGTTTQNPAREPNGVKITTPAFVRIQRAYLDGTMDWVYAIVTESQVAGATFGSVATSSASIQSIPNNADTVIVLAAPSGAAFFVTNGDGGLKFIRAGTYAVTAEVEWNHGTVTIGQRWIEVWQGSTLVGKQAGPPVNDSVNFHSQSVAVLMAPPLNAVLYVKLFQNSGGPFFINDLNLTVVDFV